MTKPEYYINVFREEIYLDNMLDLFFKVKYIQLISLMLWRAAGTNKSKKIQSSSLNIHRLLVLILV